MEWLFRGFQNAVSSAFGVNKATLTGALDIVATEHDDGTFASTPFHVRFGKLKVFRSRDKIVKLFVNGRDVGITMKLGDAGEAFFVVKKPRLRSGRRTFTQQPTAKTDTANNYSADVGQVSPLSAFQRPSPIHAASSPPRSVDPDTTSQHDVSIRTNFSQDGDVVTTSREIPSSPNKDTIPSSAQFPQSSTSQDWSWGWGHLPRHTRHRRMPGGRQKSKQVVQTARAHRKRPSRISRPKLHSLYLSLENSAQFSCEYKTDVFRCHSTGHRLQPHTLGRQETLRTKYATGNDVAVFLEALNSLKLQNDRTSKPKLTRVSARQVLVTREKQKPSIQRRSHSESRNVNSMNMFNADNSSQSNTMDKYNFDLVCGVPFSLPHQRKSKIGDLIWKKTTEHPNFTHVTDVSSPDRNKTSTASADAIVGLLDLMTTPSRANLSWLVQSWVGSRWRYTKGSGSVFVSRPSVNEQSIITLANPKMLSIRTLCTCCGQLIRMKADTRVLHLNDEFPSMVLIGPYLQHFSGQVMGEASTSIRDILSKHEVAAFGNWSEFCQMFQQLNLPLTSLELVELSRCGLQWYNFDEYRVKDISHSKSFESILHSFGLNENISVRLKLTTTLCGRQNSMKTFLCITTPSLASQLLLCMAISYQYDTTKTMGIGNSPTPSEFVLPSPMHLPSALVTESSSHDTSTVRYSSGDSNVRQIASTTPANAPTIASRSQQLFRWLGRGFQTLMNSPQLSASSIPIASSTRNMESNIQSTTVADTKPASHKSFESTKSPERRDEIQDGLESPPRKKSRSDSDAFLTHFGDEQSKQHSTHSTPISGKPIALQKQTPSKLSTSTQHPYEVSAITLCENCFALQQIIVNTNKLRHQENTNVKPSTTDMTDVSKRSSLYLPSPQATTKHTAPNTGIDFNVHELHTKERHISTEQSIHGECSSVVSEVETDSEQIVQQQSSWRWLLGGGYSRRHRRHVDRVNKIPQTRGAPPRKSSGNDKLLNFSSGPPIARTPMYTDSHKLSATHNADQRRVRAQSLPDVFHDEDNSASDSIKYEFSKTYAEALTQGMKSRKEDNTAEFETSAHPLSYRDALMKSLRTRSHSADAIWALEDQDDHFGDSDDDESADNQDVNSSSDEYNEPYGQIRPSRHLRKSKMRYNQSDGNLAGMTSNSFNTRQNSTTQSPIRVKRSRDGMLIDTQNETENTTSLTDKVSEKNARQIKTVDDQHIGIHKSTTQSIRKATTTGSQPKSNRSLFSFFWGSSARADADPVPNSGKATDDTNDASNLLDDKVADNTDLANEIGSNPPKLSRNKLPDEHETHADDLDEYETASDRSTVPESAIEAALGNTPIQLSPNLLKKASQNDAASMTGTGSVSEATYISDSESDAELESVRSAPVAAKEYAQSTRHQKRYKRVKTIRPTTEMLQKMRLLHGPNLLTFVVCSIDEAEKRKKEFKHARRSKRSENKSEKSPPPANAQQSPTGKPDNPTVSTEQTQDDVSIPSETNILGDSYQSLSVGATPLQNDSKQLHDESINSPIELPTSSSELKQTIHATRQNAKPHPEKFSSNHTTVPTSSNAPTEVTPGESNDASPSSNDANLEVFHDAHSEEDNEYFDESEEEDNQVFGTALEYYTDCVSVTATLYLWRPDAKIVISDVDGTITKSDVWGHVMYYLPIVDWTHHGVAELYANVVRNGYHVVYLTSRAIGQVSDTKSYLSNIKQRKARLMSSFFSMSQSSPGSSFMGFGGSSRNISSRTRNIGYEDHDDPLGIGGLSLSNEPFLDTDMAQSEEKGATQSQDKSTTPEASNSNAGTTSNTTETNSTTNSGAFMTDTNHPEDSTSTSNSRTKESLKQTAGLMVGEAAAVAEQFASSVDKKIHQNDPKAANTVYDRLRGEFYLHRLRYTESHSTHKSRMCVLPPGPVITSPDRLFDAVKREVILRRPQEFKIAALRDIQRMFPADSVPFYAGFGNRNTDVVAYKAVGIPEGKIFIINPQGEIRPAGSGRFRGSYLSLNTLVDAIFPAISTTSFNTERMQHTDMRHELGIGRPAIHSAPAPQLTAKMARDGLAEENLQLYEQGLLTETEAQERDAQLSAEISNEHSHTQLRRTLTTSIVDDLHAHDIHYSGETSRNMISNLSTGASNTGAVMTSMHRSTLSTSAIPMGIRHGRPVATREEYNDVNYWRLSQFPLVESSDSDEDQSGDEYDRFTYGSFIEHHSSLRHIYVTETRDSPQRDGSTSGTPNRTPMLSISHHSFGSQTRNYTKDSNERASNDNNTRLERQHKNSRTIQDDTDTNGQNEKSRTRQDDTDTSKQNTKSTTSQDDTDTSRQNKKSHTSPDDADVKHLDSHTSIQADLDDSNSHTSDHSPHTNGVSNASVQSNVSS